MTQANHAILLMHCRDAKGIVHAVTDFVLTNNGNIVKNKRNPFEPEIEFTKINRADTAAACFIVPQPNKIIIGLSIIPPPIPIIPENNPIAEPISKDNSVFDVFKVCFSFPIICSILKIAIAKNRPKICLYRVASIEI